MENSKINNLSLNVSYFSSNWKDHLDIDISKAEEINIVNSYEKTGKEEYEFIDEENNLTIYREGKIITIVTSENGAVVSKDTKGLFADPFDINNLKIITGLKLLDTSCVTSTREMFSGCRYLKSLDLSSFNTSNVTDMAFMFDNCRNLKSLDLSSFDTSNVTDMSYMFSSCVNLKTLDLSSFNTSKVTDMSGMFDCCENLESLDLSSFDTTKVTSMRSMFFECNNIKTFIIPFKIPEEAYYL